ncbi:LuxR C-terminal-related transcriptional regulator [Thermophilibacter sp. ET337]|uniref:helix-turn-helix domain-containing protein n=1 Tax=Thermophilibacter sp. ET337 TaxID=2973084 RepID=UPI0021AD1E54|nr:helix-turn-helix domain-containing protein [Thermophilibacter sp. ET337]MCR8908857.1 LuxR C-terminal-related transcriptional regulator [Thermophilibacter sp. ET337]
MEFITAGEAARRWGVSERRVQHLCAEGRVPGAERFGRAWRIPAAAPKPDDPRRAASLSPASRPAPRLSAALMPLTSSSFSPGHAREYVESLEGGPLRDVALAELAYFTARHGDAVDLAAPHMEDDDLGVRLSACLICAYANLPLGRIDRALAALEGARGAAAHAAERDPRLRAAEGFVAQAASVLLHLPAPDEVPEPRDVLPLLPPGLRAFACYVQAHAVYLDGDYAHSLGIAQTALVMQGQTYPIPTVYLHLVAIMDLMSLRRADEAREHLLAAWELARPDDLVEPFAEHHGLLGGMLEAVIKPAWPEDFRRIIDITYRFSAGWRRVHNPATGEDVADNLTTTEFAASMLATRGWTNQEIAEHLGVSAHTVKSYLSSAFSKLGVTRRRDLERFMLA